ncbi:hypothetical protein [Actinoplanes palleronii]|uniref:Guanylate cyclase domain-containing protein n=1 Tax=Actinoplanes palleronii TaxID=113570 RepID=A0ABQ4BKD5_9ACTN|nr:hypothetical protein [Actinoplanes palleronii]GIE71121.1 hypothetical protein Apa02nite_072290 [Actinoplanes palleronii]
MPERDRGEAADLPEIISIMVVDAVRFSRHTDPQQDELATLIVEALEDACHRSGLEDLWEARRFPDSTGDGYIIGFSPNFLPRVIDRYFDALQEVLMMKSARLRSRGMQLRLRLSLDLGPARRLEDFRIGSPVGKTMIATHRLVDAQPLRTLLERSDPDVTLLAVAMSDRVMADVVTAGHTRKHTSSEFVACPLEIAKKEFTATAHLHVPAMSGDILRYGLLGVLSRDGEGEVTSPASRPPEEPSPRPGTTQVSGRSNVVAGRDIDQSRRHTTVRGDQYKAHRDISIRREPK